MSSSHRTHRTRRANLQKRVAAKLEGKPGATAEELAASLQADAEDIYHVLVHLSANDESFGRTRGDSPATEKFFRA